MNEPTTTPADPGRPVAAWIDEAVQRARAAAADVPAALELARWLTTCAPQPGTGRTDELFTGLAALGAIDLTVARVAEPHLDALAILEQAGMPAPEDATWGVFAAEQSGLTLSASQTANEGDSGWQLDGTKPWCSLAGVLDRAVITAHVPGGRRAFSVDLRHPGVRVQDTRWVSRGLVGIPSGPVDFSAVPATPVGATDWYLQRSGFAWGGIGVAAIWYGGAVGVARTLAAHALRRKDNDLVALHVGIVDAALHAAGTALRSAAAAIDAGEADGDAGMQWFYRTRAVIADSVEAVLRQVGHALGPAPLTFDEDHARRVADLTVYLRQEHAERDRVAAGHRLLAQDEVADQDAAANAARPLLPGSAGPW